MRGLQARTVREELRSIDAAQDVVEHRPVGRGSEDGVGDESPGDGSSVGGGQRDDREDSRVADDGAE